MLLGRKLRGQADVLRQREWPAAASAAAAVEGSADSLGRLAHMDHLRLAEARAAALYWDVLEHVQLEWARKDRPRLRPHWRTLGSRHSPLTNSPQRAVAPGHALLNYAYALLEAETVLECQAQGLDPHMDVGPLHVDKDYRPSLASTVMESARPAADAALLSFLTRRTLGVSEFFENREGHVRIVPPLTRELAELMPAFRDAVRPMVEAVVDYLLCGSDYAALAAAMKPKPAPLAAAPRHKAGPQPIRPGVAAVAAEPIVLTTRRCAHCETLTTDAYCSPECAQAAATLAQLAEQLENPANRTPEAWSLLWPAIQRLSLARMCRATGLSKPWASVVRSGKLTPGSKFWPALCRA
ncbi:MAG: CRISPR-associated endonuclease Cas1 [Chloroflexota bacterium]